MNPLPLRLRSGRRDRPVSDLDDLPRFDVQDNVVRNDESNKWTLDRPVASRKESNIPPVPPKPVGRRDATNTLFEGLKHFSIIKLSIITISITVYNENFRSHRADNILISLSRCGLVGLTQVCQFDNFNDLNHQYYSI
jgi:hypothetical protein